MTTDAPLYSLIDKACSLTREEFPDWFESLDPDGRAGLTEWIKANKTADPYHGVNEMAEYIAFRDAYAAWRRGRDVLKKLKGE